MKLKANGETQSDQRPVFSPLRRHEDAWLDTEQQHLVALPRISSGNAASTTLTAASSW